jgi:hypothetical protein
VRCAGTMDSAFCCVSWSYNFFLSESSARSLQPENSAAAAGISRKRVAGEKVVMYGAALSGLALVELRLGPSDGSCTLSFIPDKRLVRSCRYSLLPVLATGCEKTLRSVANQLFLSSSSQQQRYSLMAVKNHRSQGHSAAGMLASRNS